MSDDMTATASRRAGATSATSTTAGSALRDVLEASLHFLNERIARKAGESAVELDEYEATQGSAEQAGYQGAKAGLQGRNPIWAAIKGAWAGASTEFKVAAGLFVVLMLLLGPIPTLPVAVGLLGAAIGQAGRSGHPWSPWGG